MHLHTGLEADEPSPVDSRCRAQREFFDEASGLYLYQPASSWFKKISACTKVYD